MRIGILTFFESDNYGTVLQAYSLIKYLRNHGHKAELVHIRRDVNEKSSHYKVVSRKYSPWERIIIRISKILHKKALEKKHDNFLEFRKNKLYVSKVFYETDEQLIQSPPEYDVYVSGGDQIWNPYHKVFSYHYMWDFLKDGVIRTSYASSFGVGAIEDEQTIKRMKKCLAEYKSIAVREKSGVEIVKKMGLPCEQVVDPVFLIMDEWQRIAADKAAAKKYCLVYALLDYPKEEEKYIKEYAKKNNLIIRVLPNNAQNHSTHFTKDFSAGPMEYVQLVSGAEHVFTNSFHGIAFSIIFNKQFSVLSTLSEEGTSKFTRLSDFLSDLDIPCPRIGNGGSPIDYARVWPLLQKKIGSSIEYIKKNIESVI